MPSKPLAVLPVFPSAVTAVAFSPAPPSASSPGGGSACAVHGSSAECPADANGQPGAVQRMLAVGLESGALEVWVVAVAGGHHDTPRIAGAAPPTVVQWIWHGRCSAPCLWYCFAVGRSLLAWNSRLLATISIFLLFEFYTFIKVRLGLQGWSACGARRGTSATAPQSAGCAGTWTLPRSRTAAQRAAQAQKHWKQAGEPAAIATGSKAPVAARAASAVAAAAARAAG